MIINQKTPEIIALRHGSGSATVRFGRSYISFSLFAINSFKLREGQRVEFDITNKILLMYINNSDSGFPITKLYPKKPEKQFLKIESKPLIILLQKYSSLKIPSSYYIQQDDKNPTTFEILIHKPIGQIGK